MPRGPVRLYLVAVAIVALGCDYKAITGGPRPGQPPIADAEKYAGDTQTTTVNSPVGIRPSVRVTGPVGQPIEGIPVTFSVVLGGGALTGADVTTDQNGVATLGSWALGTRSGANSLRVTIADTLILSFSATGTPTSPASLTAVTPSPISGVAGAPLAVQPTVRIADAYGNPVPGVSVTFQVTSGGGWASNLTNTTNALGLAATGTWTLGNVVGDNTLQAMASGLTPVSFLARAAAAAPHSMTKVSGDSQHAALRSAVSTSPAVTVRDSYGNAVSGVTVRFAVTSGGGVIIDSLSPTDWTGTARAGTWTLGATPGPNTLTASVTGAPSATFIANAVDMCMDTAMYAIGTTVHDTLTAGSCLNAAGEYTKRYALISGSPASLEFTMATASYSSQVTLYDSTGALIATTPDYCAPSYYCTGTNSLHLLLNAGSYFAGASGFTYNYDDQVIGGVTGPYTLSSTMVPEDVNGCGGGQNVYITPGVTTAQRVDSTDCWMPFRTSRFYFDQISIYMTAGKTYTISMTSADFDTYLELEYSPYSDYGGTTVAYNDDFGGSSNSEITFTPATSDLYVIEPETYEGDKTGAYTLSVSVTGVGSAAKPGPTMAPPPRTAGRPVRTFTPRPPKPQ